MQQGVEVGVEAPCGRHGPTGESTGCISGGVEGARERCEGLRGGVAARFIPPAVGATGRDTSGVAVWRTMTATRWVPVGQRPRAVAAVTG